MEEIRDEVNLSVPVALCTKTGALCKRHSTKKKIVHDLGTPTQAIRLVVLYSRHLRPDGSTFAVDYSAVSPKGSRYSTRVIRLALSMFLKEQKTLKSICQHMLDNHSLALAESTIFDWSHTFHHIANDILKNKSASSSLMTLSQDS